MFWALVRMLVSVKERTTSAISSAGCMYDHTGLVVARHLIRARILAGIPNTLFTCGLYSLMTHFTSSLTSFNPMPTNSRFSFAVIFPFALSTKFRR